ncbi:hypothetical protein AUJ46_01035 [Candidatus Peregrinibacteria bacterium CG1_02_54_53]|nr:MAG: hypothetical protein AUJ46_01035 [Candidatus Peregrinibacteria bacterium CG1_02_54_53]
MTNTPLLSIILPSYNNGECLPATIERIRRVCPKDTEVIIVVDGSTDETTRFLSRITAQRQHVRVIHHRMRRGKGVAVRSGVLSARGQLIAFIDADMAIDPSNVTRGLKWLERDYSLKAVIAWRKIYHTNWMRRLAHTIFHMIAFLLFRMPYHDTQAPMKIFRASVAKAAFSRLQTTSYAFDVEVLFRAMVRGNRIGELRVLQRKTRSSLRWHLMLYTLIELHRIYRTYIAQCVIRALLKKRKRHNTIDLFSLRHLVLWPLSWPLLWFTTCLYILAKKPANLTPATRAHRTLRKHDAPRTSRGNLRSDRGGSLGFFLR